MFVCKPVGYGSAERLRLHRGTELDGVPPPPAADAASLSDRTTELMADLVEPAKATALEKLGEGERALSVATGWLRTKVAPRTVEL
jgi:hypothetical protein